MAIDLIQTRGEVTTLTFTLSNTPYSVLVDTKRTADIVQHRYAWTLHNQGNGKLYVVSNVPTDGDWERQKTMLLHRWLLGLTDDDPRFVDHRNGDTLDDRIRNLRPLSNALNQFNRQGANRNSRSGHKGVIWYESRRQWRVHARINGKFIGLGYYKDLDEAIAKRQEFDAQFWEDTVVDVPSEPHITPPVHPRLPRVVKPVPATERKGRSLSDRARSNVNSRSGHRGVVWYEHLQKWRAQVVLNGKHTFLGNFDLLEDAIQTRLKFDEEHCKTNFSTGTKP